MLASYFKIKILVKCREYSTLGLKGIYEKLGYILKMSLYLHLLLEGVQNGIFGI